MQDNCMCRPSGGHGVLITCQFSPLTSPHSTIIARSSRHKPWRSTRIITTTSRLTDHHTNHGTNIALDRPWHKSCRSTLIIEMIARSSHSSARHPPRRQPSLYPTMVRSRKVNGDFVSRAGKDAVRPGRGSYRY